MDAGGTLPDARLPDGAGDGAGGTGGPIDEQALIYRVYAEFGDDRLPASYVRPASDNPDSTVMLEVGWLFPSLSAETQAILDPFLRPPGDPDSWYADVLAFEDLAAAANPRCSHLSRFEAKVTAHTKIWYRTGDTRSQFVADALVAEVEKIYTDETTLFGRVPPTDANVTNKCNGGDGALDIYLVPFYEDEPSVKARTISYGTGCAPAPAFIELNALPEPNPRKMLGVLAHEFFHVLQLGTYRLSAACKDYDWLGEATANWAIDHVFPNNQTEVPYAGTYMAEERKVPLDQPYRDDSDQANGYADYVLLEYLARQHTPTAIRAIWDATEGVDSVGAVAAGMDAGGGAKEVWPRFALATWNDAMAGVQDDLATWDSADPRLDWGLKKVFDLKDAGANVGDPSTTVKLDGLPGKTFKLMGAAPQVTGGVAIERLSIHADYLKFTDEAVRSVVYVNIAAVAPQDPNFKIQAMVKKGGSWGNPEDWTKVQMKGFCRDVTDERIEELVIIYSNSDTRRPSEPIKLMPSPLLSVSNVGCWRWQGTASIEEEASGAGSSYQSRVTASGLIFERWRPMEVPDGATGKEVFQVISGLADGRLITMQGCTTTAAGGGGIPTGVASGSLDIWLGLDLGIDVPLRTVAGSGASAHPTHTVFACPGADPVEFDGDMSWGWMEMPAPDEQKVEVKADGTIQGTYRRTFTVPLPGSRTMNWMLTPMRQ
jgi:hypothetical protein